MRFPNITKLSRLLLALLLAGAATVALAQERPRGPPPNGRAAQPEQRQGAPRESVLRLLPADAVTEHTHRHAGGGKLAYTATAGTLSLFDQSGERSAAIFYTAYVAKDADASEPARSPSCSTAGRAPPRPFSTWGWSARASSSSASTAATARRRASRDNPDTWLAFTDLVMIDPVGAGWSRAAKPDGGSAFWGVQRDAEALAKIIALYLAKNGRGSVAQIHPGRKLRRLPRRQGGARAAARAGHQRSPAS